MTPEVVQPVVPLGKQEALFELPAVEAPRLAHRSTRRTGGAVVIAATDGVQLDVFTDAPSDFAHPELQQLPLSKREMLGSRIPQRPRDAQSTTLPKEELDPETYDRTRSPAASRNQYKIDQAYWARQSR